MQRRAYVARRYARTTKAGSCRFGAGSAHGTLPVTNNQIPRTEAQNASSKRFARRMVLLARAAPILQGDFFSTTFSCRSMLTGYQTADVRSGVLVNATSAPPALVQVRR